MKFLALISLALTFNAFACLGGRIVLNGGKVILHAEMVQEKFSDDVSETPTQEMKDRDLVVVFTTKSPDNDGSKKTTIAVEEVKRDSGGIIYTDYKVVMEIRYHGQQNTITEYWRVNSNYVGGGIHAKGIRRQAPQNEDEAEYEITRVSNCSNRD